MYKKHNYMKITFFTGAGISAESGISTFRDKGGGGLWDETDLDEIATLKAWQTNRGNMIDFYNKRRQELKNVEPNKSHILLKELESDHTVSIVTQNVDNLHQRAGSNNVLHLHGELTKSRGYFYEHKSSPLDPIYDIGYDDIKEGDLCEETGSQIRPHVVWFGEMPYNVEESYKEMLSSDILVIVGTSLNITYTLDMLEAVANKGIPIYYIDPDPSDYLDGITEVNYIKKKASEGIEEFINGLK